MLAGIFGAQNRALIRLRLRKLNIAYYSELTDYLID